MNTDTIEAARALISAATTCDRDMRTVYVGAARAILVRLEREVASAIAAVTAIEKEIAREAAQ